jgi:hypothetical protein
LDARRHISDNEGIVAWRVISKQILPIPQLSVLDTQRHFSDELMAEQMNRTSVLDMIVAWRVISERILLRP